MAHRDTVEAAVANLSRAGAHGEPIIVRAPGRVNLLGEHTDYNDGFCLPAAIDRDLVVAATPAEVGFVVESTGADSSTSHDFVVAIAAELDALGRPPRGIVAGVASEVPVGSGLSSSAAFGVGMALALCECAGWQLEPAQLAAACRRAEQAARGIPCGPLDQVASACGRAGMAVRLDCRDLSTTPVALPPESAIVVIDSGIERDLTQSGYKARVDECREVARRLGVASLRDAQDLSPAEAIERLPETLFRRFRHVVTENGRVLDAVRIGTDDPAAFGSLIDESHASLSNDYEVSLPAIDDLVSEIRTHPGVLGARLTGGGFGGATIAFCEQDGVAVLAATFGDRARVTHLSEGASRIS